MVSYHAQSLKSTFVPQRAHFEHFLLPTLLSVFERTYILNHFTSPRWFMSLTRPQPTPPLAAGGHPSTGGCGGVTAESPHPVKPKPHTHTHRIKPSQLESPLAGTVCNTFHCIWNGSHPEQQHLQASTQRLQGAEDTAFFHAQLR